MVAGRDWRSRIAAGSRIPWGKIQAMTRGQKPLQFRPFRVTDSALLGAWLAGCGLGLPPGPEIGEIMDLLTEQRIEQGPYEPEEAYRLVRRWALERGREDPGEKVG